MDPNANLAEQAALVAELETTYSQETDDRLRLLRHDLRQWLVRGGFEPLWERHPRAAGLYHEWAAPAFSGFRTLSPAEAESFRDYARTHAPDWHKWTLYHPVCRAEWTREPTTIPATDTVPDPRD